MRYARVILAMWAMATLMAVLPAAAPGQEPTEHATKQVGNYEVTLISAPPLSPEAMQKMMPGMGGMGPMQGMPGMMGGMGSDEGRPTHWIGLVVRDVKEDRVVQGLDITLDARKDGLTRTVKLVAMPGSYGANISLPEKGRYSVMVTIARPGQPLTVLFELDHK